MEKRGEIFYSPSASSGTGATPKGQSQSMPAAKPADPDVKTQLRGSITITAPAPVFKKR